MNLRRVSLGLLICLIMACSTTPHPSIDPPELINGIPALIAENIKNWHVTQAGPILVEFKNGWAALYSNIGTGLCRPTIEGETALTYDGKLCYTINDNPIEVFQPIKKYTPIIL